MAAKEPLVSVLIPVFNGADHLEAAIGCALNQTYSNLEVVIIDDCSGDRSVELANEFAMKDSRVSVIKNDHNLGLVGNWNRGLALAKGQWVKFLFQDDLMEAQTVSKMLDLGIKHHVRLVLTDRRYQLEEASEEQKTFLQDLTTLGHFVSKDGVIPPEKMTEFFLENRMQHNFIGEPIVGLIHADVIRDYGAFDTSLHQIVDFEYWLRIATNEPIGYIAQKLHTFRVHGKSQSSRNSGNEVNPSHLDRIKLSLKVAESNLFESLRDHAGKRQIRDLASQIISRYVRRIGLQKSIKLTGYRILKYDNRIPWKWMADFWK